MPLRYNPYGVCDECRPRRDKGDKGDKGQMGYGAKGTTGEAGTTGATGATGATGGTGANGEKGYPGVPGVPGEPGVPGAPDTITDFPIIPPEAANFSFASIEAPFNGQADFGRRVTCSLSTHEGDMLTGITLQVTLPEINQGQKNVDGDVYARWVDHIGEHLISQVELEIGGQRIDRHYGDSMHVYRTISQAGAKRKTYERMIGNTPSLTQFCDPCYADVDGPVSSAPSFSSPRNALPETTLYIPLPFWFCENPAYALPVVAMRATDVKINLDIRPIDECLVALSKKPSDPTAAKVTLAYSQGLVAASLYCVYAKFADTPAGEEQRQRIRDNPHVLNYTQLQFTGDESVGSSSNTISLNFSGKVKGLVFVVQPDLFVNYPAGLSVVTKVDPGDWPLNSDAAVTKRFGVQPFNYSDSFDRNSLEFKLPIESPLKPLLCGSNAGGCTWIASSTSLAFDPGHSLPSTGGYYRIIATGIGADAGTPDENVIVIYDDPGTPAALQLAPLSSGSSTYVIKPDKNYAYERYATDLAEAWALKENTPHCRGENPVVTALLKLTGTPVLNGPEREGSYFDLAVPFQYHTSSGAPGINVLSFSACPEREWPCGYLDFSTVTSAKLQLILSDAAIGGTRTAKVRVYAVNKAKALVENGEWGPASD